MAEASTVWSKTYGGIDLEAVYSLVATNDGGYAMAGTIGLYDDVDCWLMKTDALGNVLWNRTYGVTGHDWANSLIATSDDGYALVGIWNYSQYPQTNGSSGYQSDVWLVKTDSLGNMEWNRTYGGPSDDWAYSLVETPDGGYAIAGYSWSYDEHLWKNAWLVKTDALGNMEWNRTYTRTDNLYSFKSIVVTKDGGYALAGDNLWLVKTDARGNVEWNCSYGEGATSAQALVETPDGGYAIAGIREWWGGDLKTIKHSSISWLFKTDSNGVVEWDRTVGEIPTSNNYVCSLVATSDGGYVMAGDPLVKIDSNGFIAWSGTYNETDHRSRFVVQTADGGYAVAGNANGDFWLAKTDEFGFSNASSSGIMEIWPGTIPSLILLTGASFVIVLILSILIKRKKLLRKRSLEEDKQT